MLKTPNYVVVVSSFQSELVFCAFFKLSSFLIVQNVVDEFLRILFSCWNISLQMSDFLQISVRIDCLDILFYMLVN